MNFITKIPSEEIIIDWRTAEEVEFVLYTEYAKVIVISGELLASFRMSSTPLVYTASEFEITLTPEQCWNIAIDQMGKWENGNETIWIRSDYWDEGEIFCLTPKGEQFLKELE